MCNLWSGGFSVQLDCLSFSRHGDSKKTLTKLRDSAVWQISFKLMMSLSKLFEKLTSPELILNMLCLCSARYKKWSTPVWPPLLSPRVCHELSWETWPSWGLGYQENGCVLQRHSRSRKVLPQIEFTARTCTWQEATSTQCSPDSESDNGLRSVTAFCTQSTVQQSAANALEQKYCPCKKKLEKWGKGE